MVVVFRLALDCQHELAAPLLADHARVPPENVLFWLGYPSLDKDIFRILWRYVSWIERSLGSP